MTIMEFYHKYKFEIMMIMIVIASYSITFYIGAKE